MDEYITDYLNVEFYDRLYLPGGPGGLASSGVEYVRSERHRQEMAFLLTAHQIETVLLMFHGPTADGPSEALCADYVRFLGVVDVARVRAQQETDFLEVKAFIHRTMPTAVVNGARSEVGQDGSVSFVELNGS